MYLVIKI